MHSHGAVEIVKVVSGVLDCTVSGTHFAFGAGKVIIINRNVAHRLYSANAQVVILQVDMLRYATRFFDRKSTKFADYILDYTSKPYMVFDSGSDLAAAVDKVLSEYEAAKPRKNIFIAAYFCEIAAHMYRSGLIGDFEMTDNKYYDQVKPIADYIERHYLDKITLDGICEAMSYDKYHLCRLFKKASGGTIFGYVNYLRVAHAVDLFAESDMTISQIALECGFSSVQYFNRAFKKQTGCAPKKYREYA